MADAWNVGGGGNSAWNVSGGGASSAWNVGEGGNVPGWGKVTGFVGSALESFPEMFGIEPSVETQAFRARNPVSGFVSQALGWGIPYAGGAKVISMAPRLNAIVQGAPKFLGLAERPIASIAAKWGTEAAMLEAGRLGLAASPIPEAVFGKERTESLGDLTGEAALNIAAAPILGGAVGAITNRMARGPTISQLVPGASAQQPLVQRIRALGEAAENVDGRFSPEQVAEFKHQQEQLRRANFADIEPAYTPTGHARLETQLGARYNYTDGIKLVQQLENDPTPKSGKSSTEALNTWMNPNRTNVGRAGEARLLTVDPAKGFASQGELDNFIARVGAGKNDLAMLGQNHRMLTVPEGNDPVRGQRAATELENLLTGKRKTGGNPVVHGPDDFFLMREENNGMWVVAKKVEGQLGKPKPGDQWFVMRTDTPDVLDPQAVRFRETTIDKSAYWPERIQSNIGVDRFDLANTFERELGAMQHIPKGIKPTPGAFAAMGKQVSNDLLSYVTPLVGLMGKNNRASYIGNLLKTLTDHETQVVNGKLFGSTIIDPDSPPIAQILGLKEPKTGGLTDLFKSLAPDDWQDVQSVLELQIPYEKMRELSLKGLLTPKATQVLSSLEAISRSNVEEFARLKEIVGAPSAEQLIEDFSARAGHYGLTRVRDGGFYAYLDDARTGELRGIVAGNTAKEARDKAIGVIQKQAKLGEDLTFGGMHDDLLMDEGRLQKYMQGVRKPGFLRARGELIGDEYMAKPLNAERFTQLVERNLKARERYKTNVVLQEKTWFPMQRLANEDPALHKQLEKRLAILQGDEGKFAEFQNRAVDKVLGNVLGKDSASAIVRLTQETLNAFQFGFANLAHYVINAVSMFQTTFPQAAFVTRTAGTDLSNYITVPVRDGGGRIVDSVNVLSDIKLFKNSLARAMGNDKDPVWRDLVRQMQDQGVISPTYAEAHVGAVGEVVRDLKGAFQDGHSFVKWARHLNELMLAKSEEFNRLVGVSTAYELTKILGIKDPFRIGRFTREFLSKTAYNYSTVDRPTIFTTPVGSLLGTFKTWMFHYMVNMAEYAGGGRQTLAPLLWQTAATAALGGAAATPLIKPMADAASKWFTDKSFMENVYSMAGPDNERWADGAMYGLPGMLGLSLSAQAASPGSDPIRDASMITNFALFDRMGALGRAIGQGAEAYKATGQSPWEDERTREMLIRALAPRTIYRAVSASEDKAIHSLNNGYRVLDNVSLGDSLLYSMGFNPVDLDKAYTAYSDIRKDQAKMKAATAELGRQLADAWEEGDYDQSSRVFVSAMAQGLDTASVMRSAKARMERGEATQLEFALGKDKTGVDASWQFALDEGEE